MLIIYKVIPRANTLKTYIKRYSQNSVDQLHWNTRKYSNNAKEGGKGKEEQNTERTNR